MTSQLQHPQNVSEYLIDIYKEGRLFTQYIQSISFKRTMELVYKS